MRPGETPGITDTGRLTADEFREFAELWARVEFVTCAGCGRATYPSAPGFSFTQLGRLIDLGEKLISPGA